MREAAKENRGKANRSVVLTKLPSPRALDRPVRPAQPRKSRLVTSHRAASKCFGAVRDLSLSATRSCRLALATAVAHPARLPCRSVLVSTGKPPPHAPLHTSASVLQRQNCISSCRRGRCARTGRQLPGCPTGPPRDTTPTTLGTRRRQSNSASLYTLSKRGPRTSNSWYGAQFFDVFMFSCVQNTVGSLFETLVYGSGRDQSPGRPSWPQSPMCSLKFPFRTTPAPTSPHCS